MVELDRGEKVLKMIFMTNNKKTKVLKLEKHTFNLPLLSVSPHYSAILGCCFHTIVLMWRDHLNTAFLCQSLSKCLAVISSVTDYHFRNILTKPGIKSISQKSYFMRASTGCFSPSLFTH